jgi:hypothetical protein
MRSIGSKGLIKRALPFIATFAVALFITSFFVDLNRPRFGRGHWQGGRQEMYRLRMENEQLRAENERLRVENEMREAPPAGRHPDYLDMNLEVPAPPLAPVPPVAPHAHK